MRSWLSDVKHEPYTYVCDFIATIDSFIILEALEIILYVAYFIAFIYFFILFIIFYLLSINNFAVFNR